MPRTPNPNDATTPYEREADESAARIAEYTKLIPLALAKLKDQTEVAGFEGEYEAINGDEDEPEKLETLYNGILEAIEDEQEQEAQPEPRYVQEPPYQATTLIVNRFTLVLRDQGGSLTWVVTDSITGESFFSSPWERDAVAFALAHSQGLPPQEAARLQHSLVNPGVPRWVPADEG